MLHDTWRYYGPATPRRNPQGTALSVPCPYCKAPAGERCHLPHKPATGKVRLLHRQRKVAFKLHNKAIRALEET
jgi:hypothetical protein